MVVVVVANAYNTNSPSTFGHSSDELEYDLSVNELDCTAAANGGMGRCDAQCPSGEQVVSGSCVTNVGFNANTSGLIDSDGDGVADSWRCEQILPMGGGVCNNNSVCEKWKGESPTNCFNDCFSPADDTVLFARVTCVRLVP